jgi:hypothetical protein
VALTEEGHATVDSEGRMSACGVPADFASQSKNVLRLESSSLTVAMDESTSGFQLLRDLSRFAAVDSRAATRSSHYCPVRVISEKRAAMETSWRQTPCTDPHVFAS